MITNTTVEHLPSLLKEFLLGVRWLARWTKLKNKLDEEFFLDQGRCLNF